MTLHPITGKIWTHEHGPKGGDEINIINAGDNYG
ncbi:MAG: glucose/arabinose dehydrogenase [Alphaproteobacteria bacterium]|jgi:glucose/arabinose dehydrogenase